ncbi:MAG: glycosyltransferase [Actinomycetota bacterium]|nr:MAG: glycosyltransferase [Actinomycetota bacterium]
MRLGIVGTDLAPLDQKFGALEKLCFGWACKLNQMGYEVHMFSIPFPTGIDVNRVNLHTFSDQEELDHKLGKASLDAVVINNRPTWHGAGIRARLNIFHNYPDAWMSAKSDDLGQHLADARNLAVSAALANEINTLFPNAKASVLYPFIDQQILEAGQNWPHEPIHSPAAPIRALFPNRTLEKKGLRWLIATIDQHLLGMVALTVIRNISPWTHETDEHRALLDLAHSRNYVTVTDKVLEAHELIRLYRNHDVVITPSTREEGLGLIPLEAQAVGTPVIASSLGGLKESVFKPNQTVAVGSKAELAKAILAAIDIAAPVRAAIAQRVAKTFSPEASAISLARELDNLFDGNRFG